MYAYMYVCMFACLHVCMFEGLHVCMFVCLYVCMFVCMYVCMFACLHVCMFACLHVCMFACMYVCMYVHILQLSNHLTHQPVQSQQPAACMPQKCLVEQAWHKYFYIFPGYMLFRFPRNRFQIGLHLEGLDRQTRRKSSGTRQQQQGDKE